MGAVPKKKLTRARQSAKFTRYKLEEPSFSRCPRCNTARRPHRACPTCGYYRNRQVLDVGES